MTDFKSLILLSSAYIFSAASLVAVSSVCSQYNAGAGGAYWYIFFLSFSLNSLCFLFRDVIKNCTQCASHVNCGFCHSSLLCMEGDEIGPLDSTPCADWLFSQGECPVGPGCMNLSNCSSCAASEDCAWCAAGNKCITVTEVFSGNEKTCRGAVFRQPCPDSFIGGFIYL